MAARLTVVIAGWSQIERVWGAGRERKQNLLVSGFFFRAFSNFRRCSDEDFASRKGLDPSKNARNPTSFSQ
jgi:hypothetical protein